MFQGIRQSMNKKLQSIVDARNPSIDWVDGRRQRKGGRILGSDTPRAPPSADFAPIDGVTPAKNPFFILLGSGGRERARLPDGEKGRSQG